MTRTRTLALAGIAGAALAGGYLVARSEPGGPATSSAVHPTPPVIAVRLDRAAGPVRANTAGIASTARVIARRPDPAGGPDWVLRQFKRPNKGRAGNVWCVQLGRLVDGEVAWVEPGSARARIQELGDTSTTSCAISAPISQDLGVNVGGFPDGDPAAPTTRVRTAVIWGVVDRGVAEARIEGRKYAGRVELTGHGFLMVRASDGAPPNVTLRVRDRDGGERAAIPLASWGELPNPGPMQRMPKGPNGVRPPALDASPPLDWGRRTPADQFTIAAKLPPNRVGIVSAIYALDVKDAPRPCVTSPVATIGGRPVQRWYDNDTGLVREPRLECQFVPEAADERPMAIGGGTSSGFERDYTVVEQRQMQIQRESRRPPSLASITVVTPAGARFLEVTSPVGITTVRVSSARVTVVQWDGQPEVIRAMYPAYRTIRGKTTRIGGGGVSFRALDARGRQIGEVGRIR